MTLQNLIFILVIALIIAVFALFPEARALFKGIARLFIHDMATTPEGAEAIYTEKIDQAQDAYNIAHDAYVKASGKHHNAKRDLENLKNRISKVEAACESFVKNGNMEMAELKSEERSEIETDIKNLETKILAYANAETAAKEAAEMCEKNLRKLKKERREVVENMKTKKQLKEIYDDMEELKAVTGTDKLLESVREKNKDLDAMAMGAKVAHDNKVSTKLAKADAEAKKLQSNDYLESLKKKYNK